MYNAVGIDGSKGKSTVAVLHLGGVIVRKPFDVTHFSHDLNQLISYISSLDGDIRVVMECTCRYHEPIANALSCVHNRRCQQVPAYLLRQGQGTSA